MSNPKLEKSSGGAILFDHSPEQISRIKRDKENQKLLSSVNKKLDDLNSSLATTNEKIDSIIRSIADLKGK